MLTCSIAAFVSDSAYSTVFYESCTSMTKPTAFVATSRSLRITFKSDGAGFGKGFNIAFVTFHGEYQVKIDVADHPTS